MESDGIPLHEFLKYPDYMIMSDGNVQHIAKVNSGKVLCSRGLKAGMISHVFSPMRMCKECERKYRDASKG